MKNIFLLGLVLLGIPQVASAQPGVIDGTKVRHTDTKSNYIKNTDAEKNLGGVSANPDNVNYTNPSRTTTSGQVLEGSASFRVAYNAPACTINGDGCLSEAVFEINSLSDFVKSQMCEASFKYKRVTGIGGGGSNLWVKFYDASSNILFKQDLGYINLPETGTLSAYYPCADVAKIGVGAVTGSASIDDIYFGLQTNVGFASGVPATSFTPVITHASGSMTNATTTGWYSCSNNVATVSTMTTFSGAPGTWSSFYVSMPSGLSIDLTKFTANANQVLGNVIFRDSGVANYTGLVRYSSGGGAPEVTSEAVSAAPGNVVYGSITNSSPFSFGSGDGINTTFTVPVTSCPGESVTRINQVAQTTGMYADFESADCPTGWVKADGTNGTVNHNASFVRYTGSQTISGTSYTAGTLGTAYRDQFQGHFHNFPSNLFGAGSPAALGSGSFSGQTFSATVGPITDGTNGTPRTGSTTFPNHVVMTRCKQVASVAIPLVKQAVTTPSEGMTKLASVAVNAACTASPCTIAYQSGNWVSSITRSSAGTYQVNYAANTFSSLPTCTVSTKYAAGNFKQWALLTGTPTSTEISVAVWNEANVGVDAGFHLICVGPQ